MTRAATAIVTMRALTFTTTTAVAASLTTRQLDERRRLLSAAPTVSAHCIVCRDPSGLRCCEYGRDV